MQYVKNEWIKMWSQKNAWIMLVLLLALLALIIGIDKYFDVDSSSKEARYEANEQSLKDNQSWMSDPEITADEKSYYEQEIKMIQYRMDNDLPASGTLTFSEHMDLSLAIIMTVTSIFAVIIAAGIVSSEFSTGTIKMLLTRPVARWKILLSKLVATILYALTVLVVSLAFTAILGYILFYHGPDFSLTIVDGQVIKETLEYTYWQDIVYALASLIMTTIFAFMIGSLFGSSTLAVGIALFILLMGQTATMFIAKYEFAKYIWFANDIAQFKNGGSPIIEGLTLSFSVIINIVYLIIFLAITFYYFIKRDITA